MAIESCKSDAALLAAIKTLAEFESEHTLLIQVDDVNWFWDAYAIDMIQQQGKVHS